MSDTKTTPAKVTPATARKGIAASIATLLTGIARMQWQIGGHLADARATFKQDDTKSFLAWCDTAVGLKKAAVYQYMQANETVKGNPETADSVGTIRGLSYLARFTPDERTAILAGVKGEATTAKLEASAAKVVDRVKVATAKKAEADATEAAKVKRTNKQKQDAVARKYRDTVQSALIVLEAEAMEDAGQAIRRAFLLGAEYGGKSPLLVKVLPSLYAEYDAPMASDDADDADGTPSDS